VVPQIVLCLRQNGHLRLDEICYDAPVTKYNSTRFQIIQKHLGKELALTLTTLILLWTSVALHNGADNKLVCRVSLCCKRLRGLHKYHVLDDAHLS
jgi:hypothetical protein